MDTRFDVRQIDAIREYVKNVLSPFRFEHTLGVERMAARLATLFCPEKKLMLQAAALLHDVTKEKSLEEHLEIFKKYGVEPSIQELAVPPTIHALTAALVIPDQYPSFADSEIIEAVRCHSVGRENMTLSDKIIYLSDYIEETRRYDDCIALRHEFFDAEPEKMSDIEKIAHLNRVIIHSFDLTIEELTQKGRPIEEKTLMARESLVRELEELTNKL